MEARRGNGMSVMGVVMGGWRGGCWSFLGAWIFLRAEVMRGEDVAKLGELLIRDDEKGNTPLLVA